MIVLFLHGANGAQLADTARRAGRVVVCVVQLRECQCKSRTGTNPQFQFQKQNTKTEIGVLGFGT